MHLVLINKGSTHFGGEMPWEERRSFFFFFFFFCCFAYFADLEDKIILEDKLESTSSYH
jgi:hypothetical protein